MLRRTLLLSSALVLAACGGDDDGAPAGDSGPSPGRDAGPETCTIPDTTCPAEQPYEGGACRTLGNKQVRCPPNLVLADPSYKTVNGENISFDTSTFACHSWHEIHCPEGASCNPPPPQPMACPDDLLPTLRAEIQHFFAVYKDLEGKKVSIEGYGSRQDAIEVIVGARRRAAEGA